jgi:hypothetical protein
MLPNVILTPFTPSWFLPDWTDLRLNKKKFLEEHDF